MSGPGVSFRVSTTPLVLAYHLRSSPAHIGFWCPWCRCVHVHGAGGGDGGRVAHCHQETSPFFGHGYDLLFAGTIDEGRAAPRMRGAEMIALSNYLSGIGGDYFKWRPLLDAAGNAVARRKATR